MKSRGFSLVEAVICVLILAVAVPPVLELMSAAGEDRADSVNTNRATALATLVLETVIADVASRDAGLGPAVLADRGAYLNDAESGLVTRIADLTEPYTRAGLTWELEIGERTASDGAVSVDPASNRFRQVTVRISYSSSAGGADGARRYVMPVSVMVADGDSAGQGG